MAKIFVVASFTPSLLIFRDPLLKKFQSLGHEVIVGSPNPDEHSLEELKNMGVRHISFPLARTGINPIADLSTLRNLRTIFQKEKPDHVLSYTIKPVVYGSLAAAQANVPHIHALITGLGTSFQGQSLFRRILKIVTSLLYRRALSKCQTVLFQNPDDRAFFVDNKLCSPKKITVVNGSGIDLSSFTVAPLAHTPLVFLLIARFIREKGIREYAKAARIVKKEFPEVVFRILGFFDDHPSAISKREIEGWVDEGILQYCGSTKDVRPFIAESSVYVLPSYREGLPRSVLEAMATGRAIITTDAPGCRETVIEGENGFLVKPQNIEDLAQAMKKFCLNPNLTISMGEASRKFAEKKFDVKIVNEAMVQAMGLVE